MLRSETEDLCRTLSVKLKANKSFERALTHEVRLSFIIFKLLTDKIFRRNPKSCLKSLLWSTHELRLLLSSIIFKITTFDNKLWLYSGKFPPNSCLKLLHPIATYPTSLTTAESRRSACRRKYFWTESRILVLPFDHSSSDRGLFEVRKLWANSYY